MIVDKIENAEQYSVLSPGIKKGLDFIQKTDFSQLEPGKYEIEGDAIFVAVSIYTSKNEADGKLEAHEQYLDIQYIAEGNEKIGYVPLNEQKPSIAYNPDKDVVFYNEPVSFTSLTKGMFAIYFPTDLHMPGIVDGNPSQVKKIVVKVKI